MSYFYPLYYTQHFAAFIWKMKGSTGDEALCRGLRCPLKILFFFAAASDKEIRGQI